MLDSVFVLSSVVLSLDAFPFWHGPEIRPYTPYVFSRVRKYLIFVQVAGSQPSTVKKSV